MSKNVRLSRNQRRALGALLQSTSIKAAAEKCGLCERTLRRYLDDRDFAAELARREAQMIDAGVRWLVAELEATLGTLVEIRDDKNASPAVRVRAALGLLHTLRDVRILESIERRLVAIEELYV